MASGNTSRRYVSGASSRSSSGYSSRSSRRNRDRVVIAAVESLEARRLLSAGSLDPTYGTAGVAMNDVTGPMIGGALGGVQQSDGKFIVATPVGGDFGLARYNPNGTPDTTFGDNGFVRTYVAPDDNGNDGPTALALTSTGQIVVAGYENGALDVLRYNANGTLDTNFGNQGVFSTTYGSNGAYFFALAIDSAGDIVVGGTDQAGSQTEFDVVRLTSAGTLDSSFNLTGATPGEKTLTFAGNGALSTIAVNSADQIILAGQLNDNQAVVAWLNEDGTPYQNFNNGGIETGIQFDNTTTVTFAVVAVDSSNRLILTGQAGTDIDVMRLNSDGTLDTSFNGTGEHDVSFGAGTGAQARSVAFATDGSIIIGGEVDSGGSSLANFAVVDLNPDGSLNTSFNGSGMESVSLGEPYDALPYAMSLDSSNDILIVGDASDTSQPAPYIFNKFAFAELHADGTPDLTLNGTGTEVTTYTGSEDVVGLKAFTESSGQTILAYTIIETSDTYLVRLNADGSLDTSFGTPGDGGYDLIAGASFLLGGVTVAPDGTIYVAGGTGGQSNYEGATEVLSFHADGTPNMNFNGGSAMVSYSLGGGETSEGQAIEVDGDGNIDVAGTASGDDGSFFALTRFSPDGSPDKSFNLTGSITLDPSGGAGLSFATSMAIDPSGNILVAGYALNPTSSSIDMAVARVNSSGLLDGTFGGDGYAFADFGGYASVANGVTTDSAGDVILAGDTQQDAGSPNLFWSIARLNDGGTLDTGFNGTGEATEDFGGALQATANSVAIDAAGNIVVTGAVDSSLGLAEYSPNGTLNATFGSSGLVETTLGSNIIDTAADYVATTSAGIIVAGTGFVNGAGSQALVARFSDGASATTLAVNPGTATYGGSASVSATVSSTSAVDSGSVAFTILDSSNAVVASGSSAVVNGAASTAIDVSMLGAGTYTIDAAYADGSRAFLASLGSNTLTINPAALTVTVNNATSVYGAALPGFSVSYHGFVGTDVAGNLGGALLFSTSGSSSSPVGNYSISASGLSSSNYAISYQPGTLSITPAALSVTVNAATAVYGAALPAFSVGYSGFVNNDASSSLGGSLVFTTSATQGSAVGSYGVSASGLTSGNYTISYSAGTLSITPAALTVTVNSATAVYGAALPAFSVGYAGFVNNDGTGNLSGSLLFSTSASQGSDVGNYAITASGLSSANYTIAYVAGNLSITQASLVVNANNAVMTAGDSLPTFSGTVVGVVNGDNITASYTTMASSASSAGNYSITPVLSDPNSRLSNYNVTLNNGTLTITTAVTYPLTISVNAATSVYGSALPGFTVSYSGFIGSDGPGNLGGSLLFSTSAAAGSPVGSYLVTASGLSSTKYAIVFQAGMLSITKASLSVSANNAGSVYGSALPGFSGTVIGTVNGDSITASYSTSATSGSNIGTYAIVPTLSAASGVLNNYTITSTNGVLTITRAALSVTANPASAVYGTALPALSGTLSGVVNGDNITASYSTTAAQGSNVGSYAITATLSDPNNKLANYTVTNTGATLTISKATLTVAVNNVTRAYGAANPSFSANVTGLYSGDNITVTFSTSASAGSNIGNYTINATLVDPNNRLSNYNTTVTAGTLSVTKAALTVAANALSKVYGAANPALTGTITGLVNGDNITATYATTATTSSGVGTYAITPTVHDPNGKLSNYTLTVTPALLTVTPAALTITAANATKIYGCNNPTLSVSYSGFVNGDSKSVLTSQPAVSTTATLSSNVGGYPITLSGAAAANYSITYVSGTLTITPATLYVVVDPTIKFIGHPDPNFNVYYIGFVLGQDSSVLGGTLTFTTNAGKNSKIGIYLVYASGLTAMNYDIVYVPGILIEL